MENNVIIKENGCLERISFTIPGRPFGKQRPKFSRMGNAVRTYTPKNTTQYENMIRVIASNIAKEHKFEDDAPLGIIIMPYFDIPDNTSKKKAGLMREQKIFPTKKPDWDNIGKIVCDSLNSIIYRDDKNVVEAYVKKQYGDEAKVDVVIYEMKI